MWLKKSIIYFCFWHHKLSRLLPTNLASDSNLFLIEFILRWPMIILCGFWFLSCSSLQMSLVFLSITGSEKGLSNFPETLRSTASNGWYDERGSFKCSAGPQNSRIWLRKFKASLPLPFESRTFAKFSYYSCKMLRRKIFGFACKGKAKCWKR